MGKNKYHVIDICLKRIDNIEVVYAVDAKTAIKNSKIYKKSMDYIDVIETELISKGIRGEFSIDAFGRVLFEYATDTSYVAIRARIVEKEEEK